MDLTRQGKTVRLQEEKRFTKQDIKSSNLKN